MTNFDTRVKINPQVLKDAIFDYRKSRSGRATINANEIKIIFAKDSDWFRLPGLNKEAMTIMGIRYEIRPLVKSFQLVRE